MKRASATFEEHPKGSGKWRVRARVGGKLRTIASKLTEGDAREVADAYQQVRHETDLREGITLKQFGVGFLERRKASGVRGIRVDANRWKNYVDNDPIGELVVSTVTRRDVKEWLDRRVGLAYRTQISGLNLLRVALAEAVDRELLEANPARDVKVHRSQAASSKDPLDGILTPLEQQALIAAAPELERPVIVFALCTGLRQSEQWWLRWEDVFPDHVLVRRSAGGLPTKSGKPRRVPLLPAARAALEALRGRRSPWVFPARRGARRQNGKPPRGWSKWIAAAGIDRPVRWHDLRHTCATSLLAGWWSPGGQRWSLDAVSKLLGHASVQVTERYARKLDSTLADAVAGTLGPVFPGGNGSGGKLVKSLSSECFRKAQVLGSKPSVGSSTYAEPGEHAGNIDEDAWRDVAREYFERAGVDSLLSDGPNSKARAKARAWFRKGSAR